jgi:hypothetical protein
MTPPRATQPLAPCLRRCRPRRLRVCACRPRAALPQDASPTAARPGLYVALCSGSRAPCTCARACAALPGTWNAPHARLLCGLLRTAHCSKARQRRAAAAPPRRLDAHGCCAHGGVPFQLRGCRRQTHPLPSPRGPCRSRGGPCTCRPPPQSPSPGPGRRPRRLRDCLWCCAGPRRWRWHPGPRAPSLDMRCPSVAAPPCSRPSLARVPLAPLLLGRRAPPVGPFPLPLGSGSHAHSGPPSARRAFLPGEAPLLLARAWRGHRRRRRLAAPCRTRRRSEPFHLATLPRGAASSAPASTSPHRSLAHPTPPCPKADGPGPPARRHPTNLPYPYHAYRMRPIMPQYRFKARRDAGGRAAPARLGSRAAARAPQ